MDETCCFVDLSLVQKLHLFLGLSHALESFIEYLLLKHSRERTMCDVLKKTTHGKACFFCSWKIMSEPAMFGPSVSMFVLNGDAEVERFTTQYTTQ